MVYLIGGVCIHLTMRHRYQTILNVVGVFCILYSISLIPPMGISVYFADGEFKDFFLTFLILLSAGYILTLFFKISSRNLRRKDGFLIVALFWLILSLTGSLPFWTGWHLDFIDSFFEATSGITTTGATVITHLDFIPPSILYYRQQLQFLGGMGLIVMAIAVLPLLGIGGLQLYQAETPGPMKEERLSPRLDSTVRNLCLIYLGLTISCAVAYWISGMQPLEALEHSYATVSTGGFSTHDESLGFYKNDAIYLVAIVFMIFGAINFGVHFSALNKGEIYNYFKDTETRTFLIFIIFFTLLLSIILYLSHFYSNPLDAGLNSLFETTSVLTSTGFGITDFSVWPLFLPIMMIFISFIGGCGGSTAGGIKVIRILTLLKQGANELFLLVHPKGIRHVKIGNRILNNRIVQSIWGFFAVYIVIYAILTLMMIGAGMDQVTAFSAVAACINNLGPGLGDVSVSFSTASDMEKLLSVFAMLLGRLEIFTFLVILTPDFWSS